jgi:hypothetical protein
MSTAIEPILTDEPTDGNDPRWVYDLTIDQAFRAWPCAACQTRRDEHADQAVQSKYPELDITDHAFIPATEEAARA